MASSAPAIARIKRDQVQLYFDPNVPPVATIRRPHPGAEISARSNGFAPFLISRIALVCPEHYTVPPSSILARLVA